MNFTDLSQRIEQSNPLDFGSIFNGSIELFKKVWLQGFITLLLTFVSILPFYIVLYSPLIAYGITDPTSFDNGHAPPGALIFMFLLMPFFFLAVMTLGLCLNAAFLRICQQNDLGEVGKDAYFFYLKKPYLGKALMLSLIMLGLVFLAMLTCGLGAIYLAVPMSLFPAFLAFGKDLTGMEMAKAGFALGNKNWGIIFALLLVMGLVAQLGVILCFVGFFFTAMLSKIPVYFVYKDAIGFQYDMEV